VVGFGVTAATGGIGGLLLGAAAGGAAGGLITGFATHSATKGLQVGIVDTVAGFVGGRLGMGGFGARMIGSAAFGRVLGATVGEGAASYLMSNYLGKKPSAPAPPPITQLPTASIGNGEDANTVNETSPLITTALAPAAGNHILART
jgi:hypothetical protein